MITITQQHCERCGHEWLPRIPEPVMCPACKSRIWDKPKEKEPLRVDQAG